MNYFSENSTAPSIRDLPAKPSTTPPDDSKQEKAKLGASKTFFGLSESRFLEIFNFGKSLADPPWNPEEEQRLD